MDRPPPPPARPERSVRRPAGATPSPATPQGAGDSGRFPGAPPRIGVSGPAPNAEGKNRRMMDRLRSGVDSPNSPNLSPNLAASTSSSTAPFASGSRLSPIPSGSSPRLDRNRIGSTGAYDDASSSSSSRAGSPEPDSLVVPSALSDAISAFSRAGARRADGRRGGLADQGFDVPSRRVGTGASAGSGASSPEEELSSAQRGLVPKRAVLSPDDYPDTPAFREVDEALRRVRDEWPALVRGTSLAGQLDGESDLDAPDFDPVQLAVHLLDSGGAAAGRRPSENMGGGGGGGGAGRQLSGFLRTKQQLDKAIKSTLSPALNPAPGTGATGGGADPYRAFESAITTHNATLQALSGAQKLIGGMRTELSGTREKLEGKGREGLAGMYARLGMLEEMGGLLDEMCVSPFLCPSRPLEPSLHASQT